MPEPTQGKADCGAEVDTNRSGVPYVHLGQHLRLELVGERVEGWLGRELPAEHESIEAGAMSVV